MKDRIRAGFAALDVDAAVREIAEARLLEWLEREEFAPYRPQLHALVESGRWEFLLDSFYRTIPFGTGGRRGPVGIGTNRINPYTIATSVQGHVEYLRRRFGGKDLRVVVAFDCRVFRDLRGLYDPARPNPLLGMGSRDFARLATEVYAGNGVEVVTVPGDGFLLSTPELSFAIRHCAAAGGLNVSASHNHPDDNGAKFYTEYGGQPVPPEDERMAEAVEGVETVRRLDFSEAVSRGLVRWWSEEEHAAYVEANLRCSLSPRARSATIVYSPLHGTGRFTVYDVLSRAGFAVRLVPEEAEIDGSFPAVRYRIPNPEVPDAMEGAVREMERTGADAAMASDPDADRIGLVVRTGEGPRFLTGNEIGALLVAYVVEKRRRTGTLPRRPFVVKTGVTTELVAEIARRNGVAVVGDLLVGFKYVAAVLESLAREGRYGSLEAGPEDFLLGVEESHGVLASPALRDKDAAGAALLLGELLSEAKDEGRTAPELLEDLYRRYGYFAQASYSLVLEGVTGLARIEEAMRLLRSAPPSEIAGRRVLERTDHWDEQRFGPLLSETDRASRNVVVLFLEGGAKVTVRPSGTEPKLKIYVEGRGTYEEARRVREEVRGIDLATAEWLLAGLGFRVARPGLLLSQLVSVENRVDFCERFLPELAERLERGDPGLESWVEERLRGYGKDPRHLVAPGIAAVLEDERFRPHAARLRELFFLSEGG
ncbi:MAG: phosphomannomutase [Candidatus Binatia bacterium]|nr:MAG: phosphomannomutase [Candidatus Binatia bacterium]